MLDQLTILAPGLLGGSVARAAHAKGLARRIVLWARRGEVREQLRRQPWCTEVVDTPEEAARRGGLVVLAAPVEKIVELAGQIAAHLPPGTVVTDVGSVKGKLCRACSTAMSAGVHFVGSHPMAGSQKTGWENSTDGLFDGRTCFVTPLPESHGASIEMLIAFWKALGSRVSIVDPELHDRIVAHISHLPQVVATTLCSFLAQRDNHWRAFAGGGLRDTTRIAGSDATMWIEILQQNREEILRAVRDFSLELKGLESALDTGDWAGLRRRLESGKSYRDGIQP